MEKRMMYCLPLAFWGLALSQGLPFSKDTVFDSIVFNDAPRLINFSRFNGQNTDVKHEFHTSLAEANYNAASKTLEISLRVFSDDLDAALTKANNRTVRVNETAATDPLIRQYLAGHFALIDSKNTRRPVLWVGKEIAVDVTWIYFEIPLTGNLNGMKFENSILCELFEDQVNIVNFNYQNQKRTYLFKADQAVQTVGL